MFKKIYKKYILNHTSETKLLFGKYFIGPDYINVICTILFTNISETFLILYSSYIWSSNWLFLFINLFFVNYYLFKTSFIDPGIIIRPVI